ncbi:hypothetical protein STPYR_10648 [uncultured Stenotrophomonas sp.]|uniref:PAC domain-containing protein n=1 Tax=uncultured Stenotrophomonas sp. TaxID=165438 RepID=A0A1Y5Q0B1_9GAMM|nr:hypothetical protein STPYR_10648 [uncultured Stenotrophomonas sp.]
MSRDEDWERYCVDQGVIAGMLSHPLAGAIVLLDPEGRPLAANAAARGQGLHRSLATHRLALAGVRRLACAQGMQPCSIPGNDGCLQGFLSAVHAPEGTVSAYICTVEVATAGEPSLQALPGSDETRVKALEAELREQQLQLGQVRHIAGLGGWHWSRRTGRFLWSPELHAALGRAPGSLPENRRWLALLDRPARQQAMTAWRRLHREGQPQHFELAVPAADAGEASLQLRVWMQPEPEDEGCIGKVRGQVQNITEQHQTDALVRWRTELLNRVSALGRIGGCEIEVATRSMLWTEECYRIHGLRKEPVTLEQALALYTQDSRDGFEAALLRIADGGLPEQLDLCFYRHTGQRVWVQVQIELDRREGLPERFVVLFRDITREREANERIELLAHYDLLTGLPNRVLLREQAQAALLEARQVVLAEQLGGVRCVRQDPARGTPAWHRAGDAVHRPGWFQGDQRHLRPCHRRRAAQGGGLAAAPEPAQRRPVRALQRRRIHRRAARPGRSGRRRPRRPQADRLAGRAAAPRRCHAQGRGQHWHCPAGRCTAGFRCAAARGRRGDACGQGNRAQHLPVLQPGRVGPHPAPPGNRTRAARCAGARGIPPRLPATGRQRSGPRPGHRGAAALDAPGRRALQPGRVHPGGRALRRDRPHRRMGAGRSLPAGLGMAGGRAGVRAHRGERVGHAAARTRFRRAGDRYLRAPRLAAAAAGAGTDRIGADPRHRGAAPVLRHLRAARRAAGGGRFRYRLLQPALPQPLPGAAAEDRPQLRAWHAPGHRHRRGDPGHRPARACVGHAGGGRRRGDAAGRGDAAAPGL